MKQNGFQDKFKIIGTHHTVAPTGNKQKVDLIMDKFSLLCAKRLYMFHLRRVCGGKSFFAGYRNRIWIRKMRMNVSLLESSVTETKLTMGQIRRSLIQRERVTVFEQNTRQLTEAGDIVNRIIYLPPANQIFWQAGCRLLSNNSLLRILRFFAAIYQDFMQRSG